jgi:fermentation-respiration switch protein FrsA (DUF1100 family)
MLGPSWLRLAAVVAGSYALYAALAFALQRELLFAGRRRGPKPAAAQLPEDAVSVWLELPSGRVEAFYLPAPPSAARPAPALLFAHGNAELIDDWPETFEPLRRLGLAMLLVEFPGYGRSDGSPSQASTRAAFEAGFDYLAARQEVDRTRIIGFGRSLGGGVICTLVGSRPLAGLVLASSFTSVRDFAPRMLLPRALVRDPFDNLDAVRRFQGPVLVVHGTHDHTVPYSHGSELARSAASRSRLISYDSDHNDCPPSWIAFAAELGTFLGAHGLLPAAAQNAPGGGANPSSAGPL